MDIYLIIVIILVVLAISDLVIGVANDAVNFLNSAVGSKVAPLGIIMLVAAAGIVIGSTFSGGMMEVARKGLFNPAAFHFSEIMIIFIAVMITDVILLDLFNTFGLPTSTTVSIVFELLGAAVGIAAIKILHNGENLSEMMQYINAGKALTIISGILISIALAFSFGLVIQYISRLLFSFNFKKTMKYFGSVWGGIAITFITYFIIIKGAKGASFITKESLEWIHSNTSLILVTSFIFWTILMQVLYWIFRLNILKFIVFAGTFALAMSFAGNDLVNFIGVPLAGIESYKTYIATEGASPDNLFMNALNGDIKTPVFFLLIAGLIMVLTLWLSKKARYVIKTSLNLSHQDEIYERFESGRVARSLVRQSILFSKTLNKLLPIRLKKKIEKRFDPAPFKKYIKKNPGVSFDLIRASVNLVVASVLIAFGTSLKLPLSTTYVTFMVAMGTSLADGAWGRESAVYRISGVVTVVGGWFFTAISAFTVALSLALFISWSGITGIFILVAIAVFLIIKSHTLHTKRSRKEDREQKKIEVHMIDGRNIYQSCSTNVGVILLAASKAIEKSADFLIREKRKKLKENTQVIKQLNKEAKTLKKTVPETLRILKEESEEKSHYFIEIIDYTRDLMHCMTHIVIPAFEHVDNNHKPLNSFQSESLLELTKKVGSYIKGVLDTIEATDYSDASKWIDKSVCLVKDMNDIQKKQLKILKIDPGSARTNLLFLDIISEMKNYVIISNNIFKAFRDLSKA